MAFFICAAFCIASHRIASSDEPASAGQPSAEYSASVNWERNRQLEQQVVALQGIDAERQFDAGFSILRQMLKYDPRTIVHVGNQVFPLHRITRQWVDGLRGEARVAYGEAFNRTAEQEWHLAEQGSHESMRLVALRYPATRAEALAAARLAAELIDRGDFVEARGWSRLAREHRLSDAKERRSAWQREIVCLLRLEEYSAAESLWREYQTFVMSSDVRDSMVSAHLAHWIESRLGNARQSRVEEKILPNRISREPAWRARATILTDIQELLNDALADYREQGWLDLPVAKPLVVGDKILVPQLNRLVCYRAGTGEVIWQSPVDVTLFEHNEESLQNAGFRQMLAQTLLHQVERDAVTGAMSTNGKYIFAIREWPSVPNSPSNATDATSAKKDAATNGSDQDSRYSRNRLLAYELETGQFIWDLRFLPRDKLDALNLGHEADRSTNEGEGGARAADESPASSMSSSPGQAEQTALFLNAPVVVGSKIYSVAQFDNELVLVSIEPLQGSIEAVYHLASLSDHDHHASSVRGVGAPLIYRDGMLYGASGRGFVFAFDLLARGLAWSTTNRRDDWERANLVSSGRFQRKVLDEWWEGWRDTHFEMTDRQLLVASPDMDQLRSFDATTGKILWEHPRGEGLFVSELLEDRLLIVEPASVRAVDVTTGKTLWKTAIPRPAGRGCALDSSYLLPLRDELWVRLSLQDGTAEITDINALAVGDQGTSVSSVKLGSLFSLDGGIISIHHDRVTMHADWQASYERVLKQHAENPDDLAVLDQLGRMEFEAGKNERSVDLRRQYLERQSDPASRKSALKHFLNERLAHLASNPALVPDVRDELLELEREADAVPLAQLAIAIALGKRGESADGMRMLFRVAEMSPNRREHADPLTGRIMRWDRYLQGLIEDLLSDPDRENADNLDDLLVDYADRARVSPDAFAEARFVERFGQLRVGREMRLDASGEWEVGARWYRVELALRELTHSADEKLAARALLALGELMLSKSFRADAVACFRRLRADYGKTLIDDERTAGEYLEELDLPERIAREIQTLPVSKWPRVAPEVAQVDEVYSGSVDWVLIPLQADRFGLWNRTTVAVDRRGRTVRFHSPDEPQPWEINLPVSSSMFRYVFPMHRGWGIGRLLILQVGADLFAIAPWNERGEPQAEIVWYLEGYPRKQPQLNELGIRRAPVKVGIAEPMLDVIDQYGRVIGDFGSVGAGQFYLFRNGRLEARDTATADLAWQRDLIKPFTLCTSDADFVYLYGPQSRDIETIRAVDGKTVAVHSAPCDTDDFLIVDGRHVLLRAPRKEGGSTLGWYDLHQQAYRWTLDIPAGSIPFSTDDETCGLLLPDGTLRLLHLNTGNPLAEHHVTLPRQVVNIHCIPTQESLVIAMTGPLQDPARLAATELRIDHRRPLVNGRLLSLDRNTGKLLWERDLPDVAMPLEQPRGLPLLVFNYWENRTDGTQQQTVGILKCLDLNTGNELLSAEGDAWGDHFAFSIHAEQKRIELHSPNKTIRFNYPTENKTP